MALRTFRERVLQTLFYEAGGLLIVAPLYSQIMGRSNAESFVLIAALSLAVMVWAPIHNVAFDIVDLRLSGRVASDRPHWLRAIHALSYESSTVVMTLPILILLGGHGFWAALAVDVSLTVAYAFYAYFFHIAYDRMRPVSGRRARLPARPPAERAGLSRRPALRK